MTDPGERSSASLPEPTVNDRTHSAVCVADKAGLDIDYC